VADGDEPISRSRVRPLVTILLGETRRRRVISGAVLALFAAILVDATLVEPFAIEARHDTLVLPASRATSWTRARSTPRASSSRTSPLPSAYESCAFDPAGAIPLPTRDRARLDRAAMIERLGPHLREGVPTPRSPPSPSPGQA
jgi:hypothetical protein